MIYKTLIGIGIVIAGGIGLHSINNVETYTAEKQEVEEIIVEVEETYPDDVLEASEEAKKAVLRAFELEQDRVRIVEEMAAKKAEYDLYVNEKTEAITSIDKELKTYWTVSRVKQLINAKAKEYGVSSYVMNTVVNCESQYVTDIQSKHRYKKDRPHEGVVRGQREQSFGLVQIHLPAHPNVKMEQAVDPEFAIDFLAKNLAQGRGAMWSCYNSHVAMI